MDLVRFTEFLKSDAPFEQKVVALKSNAGLLSRGQFIGFATTLLHSVCRTTLLAYRKQAEELKQMIRAREGPTK